MSKRWIDEAARQVAQDAKGDIPRLKRLAKRGNKHAANLLGQRGSYRWRRWLQKSHEEAT